MRRRTFIALAIASVGLGCGLVSGLDGLKLADGDASLVDGGPDVVLLACDGGCGYALPPGFSLVTFSSPVVSTCPDTTTTLSVISDPSVNEDACTCKCTMTTKGTCSATTVELLVSDGGFTCPVVAAALSATPGCHAANLALAASTRVDNNSAGTVTNTGVCGNSVVLDASSLTPSPAQLCAPASCETTDVLCKPPLGQRLCAIADGANQPCPAPFTAKHRVGTSASVTCSPCGADCTIGNQGCNGHLTLYEDNTCTTGSQSASSCTSIGGAMTVKSYDYTMTTTGGCTTTETSSVSMPLDAEKTVCCLP